MKFNNVNIKVMRKLSFLFFISILTLSVNAQMKVTGGSSSKTISDERLEQIKSFKMPPRASTRAEEEEINSGRSYFTGFENPTQLAGWGTYTSPGAPYDWAVWTDSDFCGPGVPITAFDGTNMMGIVHDGTNNPNLDFIVCSPYFDFTQNGNYAFSFRYRTSTAPADFAVAVYDGWSGEFLAVVLGDEYPFSDPDWYPCLVGVEQVAAGESIFLGFWTWTTGTVNAVLVDNFSIYWASNVPAANNKTLTLAVSPSGAGTTNGGGSYPSNTTESTSPITISATANTGYTFSHWSVCGAPYTDALSSTASMQYFPTANNKTLTAVFTAGGSGGLDCATLISPENGDSGVPINTILTWNSSANATSYDVYIGKTNPPSFTTNVTTTNYSTSLQTNTTYYWQIIPKNASTEAADCEIRHFTTGNSVNNPIAEVTPALWNAGNVKTGSDTSQMFILKNVGQGTLTVLNISTLTSPWSTTFNAAAVSLATNEQYLFGIKFNPKVAGNFMETFEIYTNGGIKTVLLQGSANGVAISEFSENEFQVYPNPSTGIVNVVVTEDATVKVIDITGKIVNNYHVHANAKLEFTQSPGFYFIKIEGKNKISTRKLVVY